MTFSRYHLAIEEPHRAFRAVRVTRIAALVYRGPGLARAVLIALPVLVTVGAAIALYKP